MKTSIYLVRHCESEGNACRRCHAQFDGIVTRKGILQSEALAARFSGLPVDAIYSSDSYRARMTAAPLASEKRLPIRYRMLLREYTIGIWEGKSIGNAAQENPAAWLRWMTTPWDHRIPGADPFPVVAQRGQEIIQRMAQENPGGNVVAITHSCTLTCTLTALLRQDISFYGQIKSGDNTSVTLVKVDENGTYEVIYINDDSHLPPELKRSNYTGRGADTNLAFFTPEERGGNAVLEEFSDRWSLESQIPPSLCRKWIDSSKSQNTSYRIIPYLLDRPCGLLVLSDLPGHPECGELKLFYLLPELREKGYFEQGLGEAIDRLRRLGKKKLLLSRQNQAGYQAMMDRFCFHPCSPSQELLELTVPGLEGPVI